MPHYSARVRGEVRVIPVDKSRFHALRGLSEMAWLRQLMGEIGCFVLDLTASFSSDAKLVLCYLDHSGIAVGGDLPLPSQTLWHTVAPEI
jgi:hypothetical protein